MLSFLQGRTPAFKIYYLAISLGGYAALWFWSRQLVSPPWIEYLIFILLIVIADLVNVNLPQGGASISVSTPITFSASPKLLAFTSS